MKLICINNDSSNATKEFQTPFMTYDIIIGEIYDSIKYNEQYWCIYKNSTTLIYYPKKLNLFIPLYEYINIQIKEILN